MTIIRGFFRDSGKQPITGGLTFKLDAPIYDETSNPVNIFIPLSYSFNIVNGQLPLLGDITRGIDIQETQTKNVSYTVTLYQTFNDINYYYLDGTQFEGAVHLHTDGLNYT